MKNKYLEIEYLPNKEVFLIDSNINKKRIDEFL
jgi:hypothetical protein